jgi:hypothetical protein
MSRFGLITMILKFFDIFWSNENLEIIKWKSATSQKLQKIIKKFYVLFSNSYQSLNIMAHDSSSSDLPSKTSLSFSSSRNSLVEWSPTGIKLWDCLGLREVYRGFKREETFSCSRLGRRGTFYSSQNSILKRDPFLIFSILFVVVTASNWQG